MGLLGSRGATMTAWSRERPTGAGFYWFRRDSHSRKWIVEISRNGVHFTSGCAVSLDDIKGEWQGPLEPKE